MALNLTKRAKKLIELNQPIGFQINYKLNCKTPQVPDLRKVVSYLQSQGTLTNFYHKREGFLNQPTLEGRVTFLKESEAHQFFKLKRHQLDQDFSMVPTDFTRVKVQPVKYQSKPFAGFHTPDEDCSNQLVKEIIKTLEGIQDGDTEPS